jgi:hypothetical protein
MYEITVIIERVPLSGKNIELYYMFVSDITEIFLKVELNTINPKPKLFNTHIKCTAMLNIGNVINTQYKMDIFNIAVHFMTTWV